METQCYIYIEYYCHSLISFKFSLAVIIVEEKFVFMLWKPLLIYVSNNDMDYNQGNEILHLFLFAQSQYSEISFNIVWLAAIDNNN